MTITLPGLSDDEHRTLNRLADKLEAKATRNLLRDERYDGKHAVKQIGSVIPPQYYQLAIVLGWPAKAVDVLADRCNLDTMAWADGDLASLGSDELWGDNQFGAEMNQGIVSTLLHATSFVINTRGGRDEPNSLIHFKDAKGATGEWNTRTRRLDSVLSVTSRNDRNDVTGLVLYLRNLTIVADYDGQRWSVDRQEHPWGMPVEVLAHKPRLGRPFGSSRISRAVMSMHDSALRTVIRMEGHADVYSFPEMWMLGADPSIFKNPDGSQKAAWQVMLGRIKGIPDDEQATNTRAQVQQFPAASPTPHLEMLKQQAQFFSGETSIPLPDLGVADMANPTSVDSLIASREGLIATAEVATDGWSPAIRRAWLRGLAIKNGLKAIPDEWKSITTQWRSPVHLSRAAQADAGSKQLGAVPWLAETEVGLELLGLSHDQAERALKERRRNQGRQAVLGLVGQQQPEPEPAPAVEVTDGSRLAE